MEAASASAVNNGPPYPDILADNSDSTDEVKYNILTSKWNCVHLFDFPSRIIGNSLRKANSTWFIKNTWLRYSASKDSVYCAPCRLFGPQSGSSKDKTFGSTPVSDGSNMGKLINRHSSNACHDSSLIAADNFLKIMEGADKSIVCKLSSSYNAIVSKNRDILECIIDTIILCGSQNLAIRGHENDDSNFTALLRYRAKDNSLLTEHLSNKNAKTKYTSPKIQNEIIQICGDLIVDDIVKACNAAPCYGFMADEATDASTMEQMALCVRFYDKNEQRIREEFLGFAECKSTTGEALTESFLHNLQEMTERPIFGEI
ncbi:uncharacterized protein LOC128549612 [Mercenaria mercenaria]|uniref:uncharacterized protein LOC128549612 n=1 Tax=Mercenaria mercenaria TaxID=6596 RepID=UPI00234E6638|nr:uncharacterized protein LOC128549612 [Mercenaria mercenaria]